MAAVKMLAAALAGALLAGSGVYLWRSAELASRQDLLVDAVTAQTQAEIEADRMRAQVEEMRKQLRRLRSEASWDGGFEGPAPPLTAIEDGRYFGFIERVDLRSEPDVLVIDLAEFLSGEKANEAAREAGEIGPNESVPNDYFIRNVNPMLRTLEISGDVRVRMLGSLPNLKKVELADLANAFSTSDPEGRVPRFSPYWVETESGVIVEIEEQYLP